jgi:hypothetical protein
MAQRGSWLPLSVALFFASSLSCGCGSGSVTMNPVDPIFTSVPVASADEGTPYTYQLMAVAPDGSAVTFSLGQAPAGAALTGSTISWTPSHDQARASLQFSATARTARGGSATQSWSVTTTGIVTVTAVNTFWTPTGSSSQPRTFPADLPYPAALVPQSGGSFQLMPGKVNADGTVSIHGVPAGFYWLALSPADNYWTSTAQFDAGGDITGTPISATSIASTTFDISLTNADPIQTGDFFSVGTNVQGINLPAGFFLSPGSTTYTSSASFSTNIDFSKINTLYFAQYEPLNSGAFTGSALGTALTQSNVTITNGAVNNLGGALNPAPKSSIPLKISGSAWANNFQNIGPAAATPVLSSYALGVQPFTQGGVVANPLTAAFRSTFVLLAPSPTPGGSGIQIGLPSPITATVCGLSSGPNPLPINFGFAPIITDQDFGTLSYGDPYPASWLREFDYCQIATVPIPRPNSTATDTFQLNSGQTTDPSATNPVAPLIGPVQSPTVNGASLFQAAALNTTNIKLAWTPPVGATPYGYYVTIYQLATLPSGSTGYLGAGRLGTSQTSLTVPFISANSTYVFLITAEVNAAASMETAPFRAKLPLAHTSIVSAPITINPGAGPTP